MDVDNATEPAAGDALTVDGVCYRPPPCPPLTDAEKLRCVALWLDTEQAIRWTSTEVQSDLRRIADLLELGGHRLAGAEAVCRAHGRDVVSADLIRGQDKLIADLREEVRDAHGDALALEQQLDEVRNAVEHFVEDDDLGGELATIDLVLRALEWLDVRERMHQRAESELELAKCWGAELADLAVVDARENRALVSVLTAMVRRAAAELDPRTRQALLADLEATLRELGVENEEPK